MRTFIEITEEERRRCRKVAEVFSELYELYGDMTVVDAGKYGFVHLTWFNGTMFEGSIAYTDSKELFRTLWSYWLEYHLLQPVKNTDHQELEYEDLYERLSLEEKEAFKRKRQEFWENCFDKE